jgi:hypothetical protein
MKESTMDTHNLITMLSKNAPAPRRTYIHYAGLSLLATLLCAIGLIAYTLGLRSDLLSLFSNKQQTFKYVFTTVLLLSTGLAWWQHGQIRHSIKTPLATIITVYGALLLMAMASIVKASGNTQALQTIILNSSAFWCVGVSITIATGISFMLTHLGQSQTPLNAKAHGYFAALFAISASLFAYALHCPFDEPLYIASWYSTAIILFTLIAGPILAKKSVW